MFRKIERFLKQDIWRIRAREAKGFRGKCVRLLRIFLLSFKQFSSDMCSFRASALTFYSLLSIVPVLAMSFGIAKGFGLDKSLREKLLENMQGQEEIFDRIIAFAENLLENARGGIIAGVGLALLFWAVIQVFGNIEASFNDIWGIKKQRSLGRKFADYLSMMLIAPVLYIVASSATVFVTSQVTLITEKIAFLGLVAPLIIMSLKILPYLVFWGLLTYLYIAMPNGKIHFKSALLGGIVAGTLYQIVQWIYIRFQIGVSNAGAIYGSFAALPLFLIWLQMSWRIVLYGAELAFSHQNELTFEFEQDCLNTNYATKKLFSLRIAQLCVSRFAAGMPPLSAEEIAAQLEMPVRLARDLIFHLTESGILITVQGESERDRSYLPARDVADMTVQFVIEQMEKAGTSEVQVVKTPELDQLRGSLLAFDLAVQKLPENKVLKSFSVAGSK
ncbi:MAG: YihY/virulence factor BrkB family protein [Candidatus Omnitrophica bacterium]|nr:YihY/virulence factor BrkB family protein [Candidatus Omnitrophota bacterium]MDD5671374.1 YihY/virulence factor BrkB family protein [Candidatus Omnitrophota bacterium]